LFDRASPAHPCTKEEEDMMTFSHRTPVRPAASLVLALCLAAVLPGQATWIVDASNGPGTNFTTIQAAVNASAPGDKIFVKSGLYVENVVIDKGITMVGWNATTYPMSLPPNPYAAAIQGTLGIINVDNFQTCVISGLNVVPNGTPGISVGILNSRGPIVLDRIVIQDGALYIYGGEDVILQEVRVRAAAAGAGAPPQPGITVIGSWVQGTDLDVVGGAVGAEPDFWPEGGPGLLLYYPSIVGLARPKLMGGSGGGPWDLSSTSPNGAPAIRNFGGIVAIVDDDTAANYLTGGNGGVRAPTSSPSIPSGDGGNAIEVLGGYVLNKRPMPVIPGSAGANMAGGAIGSAGSATVTSGGGTYISITDVPALFSISGSSVAGGTLTFTFHSAAPGLLCGLGACDDFDLAILGLTPSVQFCAGKPSAVQFLQIGTSNAMSQLAFTAPLPSPLGIQQGRRGMAQGGDVVNNLAYLSNPTIVVVGYDP
jgi:hypothetical protein